MAFSNGNIMTLYRQAVNEGDLNQAEEIVGHVVSNFREMASSGGHLEFTVDELAFFLAKDDLEVSGEIDVVNAVLRWVLHDFPMRKASAGRLLSFVRFGALRLSDILHLFANSQNQFLFEFPKILNQFLCTLINLRKLIRKARMEKRMSLARKRREATELQPFPDSVSLTEMDSDVQTMQTLQELVRRNFAAQKIQSFYTSYMVRERMRRHHHAATIIQAAWRGFTQRKSLKAEQRAVQKETPTPVPPEASAVGKRHHKPPVVGRIAQSAVIIQKMWRKRRARRKFLKLRLAAIVIQAHVRKLRARRQLLGNLMKEQKQARAMFLERTSAAIMIQKWVRGFLVRRKIPQRPGQKLAAIVRLQVVWRGYRDRKHAAKRRKAVSVIQRNAKLGLALRRKRFFGDSEKAKAQQERVAAATKIQAWTRGHLDRLGILGLQWSASRIQKMVRWWLWTRKRRTAAVSIQAHTRGFLARKRLMRLDEAALTVQTWYRGARMRQKYEVTRWAVACLQVRIRGVLARKKYMRMRNAAIRIQAWTRGHLARQTFLARQWAATVLQSHVRGYLTRERLGLEEDAAIVLQAAWRGMAARRQWNRMRNSAIVLQALARGCLVRAEVQQRQFAAVVIQKCFRGSRVRSDLAEQHAAATIIQTAFRGYLARRLLMRHLRAAVKVQAWVRGHLCRQDVLSQQWAASVLQKHFRGARIRGALAMMHGSATLIQASYRGHRARKRLLEEEEAATVIQAAYRGHRARMDMSQREQAAVYAQSRRRMIEARTLFLVWKWAATVIQAAFRGFSVRRRLEAETKAATKIQAWSRGHRTRLDILEQQWSAATIQKHVRGFLVRRRLRRMSVAAALIQNAYRQYKEEQVRQIAATRIQARIRGWKTRQLRLKATLALQKYFRGYLVRRDLEDQDVAATLIQSRVRGHQARQRFSRLKWAATTFQRHLRGHRVRQKVSMDSAAATVIQAAFRGHRARSDILLQQWAASIIQKHWRGWLVRRFLAASRAAVRIQAAFRGMAERKMKVRPLQRDARRVRLLREARLKQEKAATSIQAAFRGHWTRRKLHGVRRAAVLIQSWYRGRKQRRAFLTQRKSSAIIQKWFRGFWARLAIKRTVPKDVVKPEKVSFLILGGVNPLKKDSEERNAGGRIFRYTDGQDAWELIGYLPVPVKFSGYVLHENKIHVIGGFNLLHQKVTRLCQILDPSTGHWILGTTLQVPRRHHGACSAGGLLVALGGMNAENELLDTVEFCSSPLDEEWKLGQAKLSSPRAAFSAAAFRNRIWICGGFEKDTRDSSVGTTALVTVNEIQCYDPIGDEMVSIPFNLRVPRAFAAMAECENVLYLVGGVDGQAYIRSIEGFGGGSVSTTIVGNLRYARRGPSLFVSDGCLIIVGGRGEGNEAPVEMEAFSRRQITFDLPPNLPHPMIGFGCITLRID